MARPRRLIGLALVFLLIAAGAPQAGSTAPDLPSKLTDQEFWQLSESLSEPNGVFGSDNLLSNEMAFRQMVPPLAARTTPGGVYMGVGPEQNFTYMAATKPRMAFITDIRRGNLHLQLMYKALFELSADRSEFVSRLFTKPRQASVTSGSTSTELMNAYWDAFTSDEAAYAANLAAIQNHLTKTHTLPLTQEDLDGVARVYRAFYWYGPSMNYSANTMLTAPPRAGDSTFSVVVANGDSRVVQILAGSDYRSLMTQTDENGRGLSYLASEETFGLLKDLEARNMVVPVVGNFAGPKALKAVGAYIKGHGATVSAFYVSNVESYLTRAGTWSAFCANVATLPLTNDSVFIRPGHGLMPIVDEVRRCG